MKRIFIMRGAPGSGKSTLIKELGLEDYAISMDDIRVKTNGLELLPDGSFGVSQKYNGKVYNIFKHQLELRMKNGAFTIYDATNTKADDLRALKKIVKQYGYTPYLVDFNNISLSELLERNKLRGVKQVPEKVIIKMYDNLQNSQKHIPSWLNVIKPEEMKNYVEFRTIDLNNYKKIHHFGDIHASYEPLEKYFLKEGWLKDDEFYIFIGDFLDRGIETEKVLSFMLRNYNKKNVVFINGNHDIHLYNYANNKTFNKNSFGQTKEDIETSNLEFKKKDIRRMMDRFVDAYLYTFNGKTVLCTHGGLPLIPDNINLINSTELIRGIGGYEFDIDKIFTEKYKGSEIYQVHGHRNILEIDIDEYSNSFNLEGKVEFGGHLRVLTLDNNGFKPITIKNNTYKITKEEKMLTSVKDMYEVLSNDSDIRVKKESHIHSLNFKNTVFRKRTWNRRNTKARGLFINTDNYSIVARGYDKFFNYEEGLYNNKNDIEKLNFPVNLYLKENGYLGLLGYDETNDELVFCSKSTCKGDYAFMFKEIMLEQLTKKELDSIKQELKDKNISLTFEVIEPNKDPHIIKYDKPQVILLDMIKRTPKFEKLKYEEVVKFGNKYNFKVKEFTHTLNDFNEYLDFVDKVFNYEYQYKGQHIEGFIVEDMDGYMFKLKLPYYTFWKHCRTLIENLDKYEVLLEEGLYLKNKHSFYLLNEEKYKNLATDFLTFIVNNKEDIKGKDIIYVKYLFENQ